MSLIPEACFFTGHRLIPNEEKEELKASLKKAIVAMIENGVTVFICGGALGFDTLAAQTVLDLKKNYDIRLCMYLPCDTQHIDWECSDVFEYTRINSLADEVFYVSRGEKTPGVMKKRNKAMVEAADYGICYMKDRKSGTGQTVNMAEEKGISIINLYEK